MQECTSVSELLPADVPALFPSAPSPFQSPGAEGPADPPGSLSLVLEEPGNRELALTLQEDAGKKKARGGLGDFPSGYLFLPGNAHKPFVHLLYEGGSSM